MKIRRTIALASAAILAAGCAHEQHQAQYNESVAPNATQSSQYNSSQYTGGQSVTVAGTSTVPNDTLVNQVRQSLQQDPKIAPVVPNIQITADHGLVVLSGTVQSREQKMQIQSTVAGLSGVDILDDQLRVSGSAMNPTSRPDAGSQIYSNPGGNTNDEAGNPPPNPTANGDTNSVNQPHLLNPTSNNTNSPPRIYHDAGTMNSSTNNALNATSQTNGPSQIYQEQNSQGMNTNGNNKIP